MSEIAESKKAAQLAILKGIEEVLSPGGSKATGAVKDLAEAYAWLTYPDNAHGGGA